MSQEAPVQKMSGATLAGEAIARIERIAEFDGLLDRPEFQLPEVQSRLQQLVEHIPKVFWLYDRVEDQMAYVSPAYEKIWGRSTSGLYQNLSDWFDAIHEDDRSRVCRAFVAKAAVGCYDESYRVVQPDGKVRWVHDCGYPVQSGGGKVLYSVGIVEDITEQRQAHLQQLKATNSATTAQLLKGIANESHEALQANQACLCRLRCLFEGDSDGFGGFPEALSLVDDIQLGQDQLHNLYHQVRRYVSFVKCRRTPCDLENVLQESWHQSVGQRESRLCLGPTEIDLVCEVDRSLIVVAFCYLIENALECASEPLEMQVFWSESKIGDRPALQVSLRDNSHGCPPSQIHRMFEPFYLNSGLNMAIVERVIEGHGGRIRAVECSGVGREVCITLPRRSL